MSVAKRASLLFNAILFCNLAMLQHGPFILLIGVPCICLSALACFCFVDSNRKTKQPQS